MIDDASETYLTQNDTHAFMLKIDKRESDGCTVDLKVDAQLLNKSMSKGVLRGVKVFNIHELFHLLFIYDIYVFLKVLLCTYLL